MSGVMIEATLLHRRSRLACRLAAECRLAASRGSNGNAAGITLSSEKELAAAEKMTATSPPMVPVMAAGLPVLNCCESNIGEH